MPRMDPVRALPGAGSGAPVSPTAARPATVRARATRRSGQLGRAATAALVMGLSVVALLAPLHAAVAAPSDGDMPPWVCAAPSDGIVRGRTDDLEDCKSLPPHRPTAGAAARLPGSPLMQPDLLTPGSGTFDIVPGRRIGFWRLGMTLDELARLNGPASSVTTALFKDGRGGVAEYVWTSRHLMAGTLDRRRAAYLCIVDAPAYATDEGIGIGATRAEIEEVYGRPDAVTRPLPGATRLIYDRIGIAFVVYPTTVAVVVFPPGTAERWWLF